MNLCFKKACYSTLGNGLLQISQISLKAEGQCLCFRHIPSLLELPTLAPHINLFLQVSAVFLSHYTRTAQDDFVARATHILFSQQQSFATHPTDEVPVIDQKSFWYGSAADTWYLCLLVSSGVDSGPNTLKTCIGR